MRWATWGSHGHGRTARDYGWWSIEEQSPDGKGRRSIDEIVPMSSEAVVFGFPVVREPAPFGAGEQKSPDESKQDSPDEIEQNDSHGSE